MDSDGDAAMENGGIESSANNGGSYDSASPAPAVPDNSVCEECADRRSIWDCKEGCGGVFCDVCFYALHRKGKRALHKPERIERAEAVGTGGGGKGLSGWIGPRLPAQREVANPDMYDRSGTVCGFGIGCVDESRGYFVWTGVPRVKSDLDAKRRRASKVTFTFVLFSLFKCESA